MFVLCWAIYGKDIYNHRKLLQHSHGYTLTSGDVLHHIQLYFGKELYMFQTDLLPIIRSLNTVYTAIGICHVVVDSQHN